MIIKKILEKLNFSEKESLIYLKILELGQSTVSTLAEQTDVKRTTVYDVTDALLKKAVISKFIKDKTTYFNALDPEKLLNYLDRDIEEKIKINNKKKEMVLGIMPELISMQGIYAKNKPKVRFFEGEKGLREAHEDTLTAKGIILAYANVEEMHKALPNFFPEYYKRRVDLGIRGKGFYRKNIYSELRVKNNKEELRQTKFLPDDVDFSPEMSIYNNKILYVSWKEKMAVIIESKEIADFHKNIFNLLWDKMD